MFSIATSARSLSGFSPASRRQLSREISSATAAASCSRRGILTRCHSKLAHDAPRIHLSSLISSSSSPLALVLLPSDSSSSLPSSSFWSSAAAAAAQIHSKSNSSENMSANSALQTAVSKEDLTAVDAALANGENPNTLNSAGQAPLHVIVTKSFRNENTFPIILSLLRNKADINLANSQGVTAIQIALQSGWQDTAGFLFQLGAKFDAAARKNTNIRCPDCLRVAKGWEEAGYKQTPYPFENKKWADAKL